MWEKSSALVNRTRCSHTRSVDYILVYILQVSQQTTPTDYVVYTLPVHGTTTNTHTHTLTITRQSTAFIYQLQIPVE